MPQSFAMASITPNFCKYLKEVTLEQRFGKFNSLQLSNTCSSFFKERRQCISLSPQRRNSPTISLLASRTILLCVAWGVCSTRSSISALTLLENHDQINKQLTNLCWLVHCNDRFNWFCNFCENQQIDVYYFVDLYSTMTKTTKC